MDNSSNKGKKGRMGKVEMGLTLRTQPRYGEQQTSWCSLEVARSPMHVIFPIHQGIHHLPHRTSQRASVNNYIYITIDTKDGEGGEYILDYIGISGFLELPPQQSPRFSRVNKATNSGPDAASVPWWKTLWKSGKSVTRLADPLSPVTYVHM